LVLVLQYVRWRKFIQIHSATRLLHSHYYHRSLWYYYNQTILELGLSAICRDPVLEGGRQEQNEQELQDSRRFSNDSIRFSNLGFIGNWGSLFQIVKNLALFSIRWKLRNPQFNMNLGFSNTVKIQINQWNKFLFLCIIFRFHWVFNGFSFFLFLLLFYCRWFARIFTYWFIQGRFRRPTSPPNFFLNKGNRTNKTYQDAHWKSNSHKGCNKTNWNQNLQ
jgi:hypothetical protein